MLQIGKIMLKNQKSRVFQNEPWSRVFQYGEFQSEQNLSVSVLPDPKKLKPFQLSYIGLSMCSGALESGKQCLLCVFFFFRHDFDSTE